MNKPAYTLTLTEEQANALVKATDMLMRLHLGQLEIVTENLMFRPGVTPEGLAKARDYLNKAKFFLFPEFGGSVNASHSMTSPQNTEVSKVAYDLHQVIRHQLAHDEGGKEWSVWRNTPMRTSKEPMPEIKPIA